jgi:hypothetical protein
MNVERLGQCNRAALHRHIRAGTPFVVPGFARGWPAFARWTPEYVAGVCGDRPVAVSHYPDGKTFDSYAEMTVAAYLATLAASEAGGQQYYLESGFLSDLSPALYDDLPYPDYLNDLPDVGDQVFFGRGAGSCCHIHPHEEAVVLQLMGPKVFHLYHPDDARYLYLEPVHRDYRRSRIDFAAVDYRAFPLARHLNPVTVTLAPGDLLYIPVHWPHWTAGVGVNLTITRFFTAKLRHYRFPNPGLRCLLGRLLQSVPFGR